MKKVSVARNKLRASSSPGARGALAWLLQRVGMWGRWDLGPGTGTAAVRRGAASDCPLREGFRNVCQKQKGTVAVLVKTWRENSRAVRCRGGSAQPGSPCKRRLRSPANPGSAQRQPRGAHPRQLPLAPPRRFGSSSALFAPPPRAREGKRGKKRSGVRQPPCPARSRTRSPARPGRARRGGAAGGSARGGARNAGAPPPPQVPRWGRAGAGPQSGDVPGGCRQDALPAGRHPRGRGAHRAAAQVQEAEQGEKVESKFVPFLLSLSKG